MPLVTVIMPAYQAARTIVRAIESIRAQEFSDWNLTVIDDGSTDETGQLARQIAARDPRVQVLTNPENQGAAVSMNRGWKSSDSHFVAIMDADDAALPSRLKLQSAVMAMRPELSVLGAAAHFVTSAHEFMRTVVLPTDHETLLRRRWYACPFIHPTVMMRREFLEQTGGYTDGYRLGEDYDLWMRGFFAGTFRYANLPEPLLVYTGKTIQRWTMIEAGARVRVRAGQRERRQIRGRLAALRILAEGAIEQSGIFAWRDKYLRRPSRPSDLSRWVAQT